MATTTTTATVTATVTATATAAATAAAIGGGLITATADAAAAAVGNPVTFTVAKRNKTEIKSNDKRKNDEARLFYTLHSKQSKGK